MMTDIPPTPSNMTQEQLLAEVERLSKEVKHCHERIEELQQERTRKMQTIDIVFDGPPGPVAGRFVEVEDESGASISFGEWIERDDGFWALRIPDTADALEQSRAVVEAAGELADMIHPNPEIAFPTRRWSAEFNLKVAVTKLRELLAGDSGS